MNQMYSNLIQLQYKSKSKFKIKINRIELYHIKSYQITSNLIKSYHILSYQNTYLNSTILTLFHPVPPSKVGHNYL